MAGWIRLSKDGCCRKDKPANKATAAPSAKRQTNRTANVTSIDPAHILQQYYPPGSASYDLLVRHGEQVAHKALSIANRLRDRTVDQTFLYEAAMLHDIGIFLTDTPTLGCHGDQPYIRHGILGRALLETHGLDRHALVCERHVGVGLSANDIRHQQLPLPRRDMLPLTVEEEIICYADKFFSKKGGAPCGRTIPEIFDTLRPYGEVPVLRFQAWVRRFENGCRPPTAPRETGKSACILRD